jgi:hypothetical protein
MGLLRFIVLLALLLSGPLARAQPAAAASDADAPTAKFGAPGTLAATLSTASGYRYKTPDYGNQGVAIQLTLHAFVAPGFSVGVDGAISWSQVADANISQVSHQWRLGVRGGRWLAMTPWLSVWPQVALGVIRTPATEYTYAPVGATPAEQPAKSLAALTVEVPVLIHPVRWFFIGFGPALDAALGGEQQVVNIGARFTFGGAVNVLGG